MVGAQDDLSFCASRSGELSVLRKTSMNAQSSKAERKEGGEDKLVETVNALGQAAFAERFCNPDAITEAERALTEKTAVNLEVILLFAESLKRDCKDVLEACFNLIEETSANDYNASEIKWSPSSKRKEMVLPDMRYFLVRERDASSEMGIHENRGVLDSATLGGFVSFMITYEDGHEVIYVYEVHLVAKLRGQGVGTVLMQLVENVGRKAQVEKCMLTVFKANKKAVKWYERCGYTRDDFSPGPRVLRNGRIKEPTYLILSKLLNGSPSQCSPSVVDHPS